MGEVLLEHQKGFQEFRIIFWDFIRSTDYYVNNGLSVVGWGGEDKV